MLIVSRPPLLPRSFHSFSSLGFFYQQPSRQVALLISKFFFSQVFTISQQTTKDKSQVDVSLLVEPNNRHHLYLLWVLIWQLSYSATSSFPSIPVRQEWLDITRDPLAEPFLDFPRLAPESDFLVEYFLNFSILLFGPIRSTLLSPFGLLWHSRIYR